MEFTPDKIRPLNANAGFNFVTNGTGKFGIGFPNSNQSALLSVEGNVAVGDSFGSTAGTPAYSLAVQNNISAGIQIGASVLHIHGSSQFGTTGVSISSFTTAGYFTPAKFTKADIDALAGVVGAVILCTDCTRPYDVCVGTGTGTSQWRVSGAAGGCGSGN